MTVRISVDRLPPEVVEALDRGDTVVFERLGKVTAVARPEETSGSRLWHELAKLAPPVERCRPLATSWCSGVGMGVLIDTSWLIDVERRLVQDPRLAAELPDEPFVSSITIAELRMGVELSDAAHRRNREAFVEVLVREATIVAFGLRPAPPYVRPDSVSANATS
ncbi:MAG: hypothetical protein IPF51_09290 [Dehalococcoidia bacterium]|uniref:hypothetical protein n=1 Tax=Candidatus Amarobacter glycogenicus TaxID=3140699 RepID=UPI003136F018|nr:hypothetical protein [Dehalococcoidia bacterium]